MQPFNRPVSVTIIGGHEMLSSAVCGLALHLAARSFMRSSFMGVKSSFVHGQDGMGIVLAAGFAASAAGILAGFLLLRRVAWARFLFLGTYCLRFVIILNTLGPSVGLLAGAIFPAAFITLLFTGQAETFFSERSSEISHKSSARNEDHEGAAITGDLGLSNQAICWLVAAGYAIACSVLFMAWPDANQPWIASKRLIALAVLSGVVAIPVSIGVLLTPAGGRRRVAGLTLLWSSVFALAIVFVGAAHLLSMHGAREYKDRLRKYSVSDAVSGTGTLLLFVSLGWLCIRGTSPPRRPTEA